MATLKSYSSGTLKLTDYLIATDLSTENVTRNFQVSEVVNAILKALSIGTVTSVSTGNSDFINFTGGPITTSGSLTASLSASGTPSSATYLRGDGTWSEPGPTPTDIYTNYNGVTETLDTTSWKFTGTGVTASSIDNNVTVNIPGLLASVESIINATGITAVGTVTTNPSTGDVTITNAGVYQAKAGGNVTLTGSATPLEYSSDVTINTRANAGKIVGVDPGQGTDVTNNVTNPLIDIDFAGNDNYIDAGESIQVISSDDFIAFQDLTASEVKTTKLNTFPTDALVDVKSSIDTGDTGKISTVESPNYPNVWGGYKMVTLTINEYNQLTPKDNNTLYFIVGAGTTYTVTYQPIYNITLTTGGTAPASAYSVTETINGGACASTCSITGVVATAYSFVTTITAINGYSISSGGSLTTSGTISADATLTPTVSAVLAPPTGGNCVVTLQIYNGTGGTGGGSGAYPQNSANFGIYGGTATTGATTTVAQGSQYSFNTSAYPTGGYNFTSGPTYSGFSGTAPYASNYTASGTIGGDLNIVASYSVQWTPVVLASNFSDGGGNGPSYVAANISISPNGNISYGYIANAGYSFPAPAVVTSYQLSTGTLTLSGLTWTPPFPISGLMPNPGQNLSFSPVLTGTATFTPTANPVTVNLAYTDSVSGGSLGNEFTVNPTAFSLNNIAQGSSYNLLSSLGGGTTPVVSASTGYNFTSGPSVSAPSGLPYTGTAPPGGGTCTYTISGTLVSSNCTVQVEQQSGVPAGLTYNSTFIGSAVTRQISTTNTQTNPLSPSNFAVGNGSITVTVNRTAPSAAAQDAGQIQFIKNSSTQNTQSFSLGNLVSKQYTFMGVTSGDALKVLIIEG